MFSKNGEEFNVEGQLIYVYNFDSVYDNVISKRKALANRIAPLSNSTNRTIRSKIDSKFGSKQKHVPVCSVNPHM